MNCRENCPFLGGLRLSNIELSKNIDNMQVLQAENEFHAKTNTNTAQTLAKLPQTPDVADARRTLQEAVVSLIEAQNIVQQSISAQNAAIDANLNYGNAVEAICPGLPIEMADPMQPGKMILVCASTAFEKSK